MIGILFWSLAHSLYLPGSVIHEFKSGEAINLVINSLRSSVRPIPLDYFANDVFCASGNSTDLRTNIGEHLTGDVIRVSPMQLKINEADNCVHVCKKHYNESQIEYLKKLIDTKYRVFISLDSIPVSKYEEQLMGSNKVKIRTPGFDLGYVDNDNKHYVSNHIQFVVKLSTGNSGLYRIVGFEVENVANGGCKNTREVSLEESKDLEFSFSVKYEMTDLDWYKRWNDILSIDYNPRVHWFSISNTLLLVLCMSILIIVVLVQTIKNDFNRAQQAFIENEEPLEEIGWKLVHGDVFRPPVNPSLLCASVGSGFQLALGAICVIGVAALGFLAPLNTGSMLTTIAVVYTVVAPFAGVIAGKLHTTIGNGKAMKNCILSASEFVIPSLILYLIANIVFTANKSSASITRSIVSELAIMVCLLDFGLFGLGYMVGVKSSAFDLPARVNNIPRNIPKQPFFLSTWFTSLVAGVIIFAAIYVQIYFVFVALWTNLTYYYLFGLLFIVLLAMLLVSCEISIFVVYLMLCYENHRWWWASFRIPASVSLVFFAYCIYFMLDRYHPADMSSALIYLIFCVVVSLGLALANGSVGFLSSFIFVRKVFGALKME